MRAISEAHRGVEALVPPFGWSWPIKIRSYIGSPARAAISGVIRPSMLTEFSDFTFTFWHVGRWKCILTPPPVEPPPLLVLRPGASHQVTSLTRAPEPSNIVPPTASAKGLELGKSI